MPLVCGLETAWMVTLLPKPSRNSPVFRGAPGLRLRPSSVGNQRRGKMLATDGTQMAQLLSFQSSTPYWTVLPRCWSPAMWTATALRSRRTARLRPDCGQPLESWSWTGSSLGAYSPGAFTRKLPVTVSVVVPLGSVQTLAKIVCEIAAFIHAPSQSCAQASKKLSCLSPSSGKSGLSELFLAS